MRYRKRPVVVDAFHFDGTNLPAAIGFIATPGDHFASTLEEAVAHPASHVVNGAGIDLGQGEFHIHLWNAEERQHIGVPDGHWIIRGVNGELYPCSPDVFVKTYEPVEDR